MTQGQADSIRALLAEVCGTPDALDPDTDLLASGILDSLALIELLEGLEDLGYELSPTRVDRNAFRTVNGILELCRGSKETDHANNCAN